MSGDNLARDETHLWETDHPYYCAEGNFYKTGLHQRFGSWAEFHAAQGNDDADLNLVFRWDWNRDETHCTLTLYLVNQRKPLNRSVAVTVTPGDEPAIRAWLETRARTMAAIWAPIAVTP